MTALPGRSAWVDSVLKFDPADIEALKKEFGDQIVEKATVGAINKTVPKLRTYVSKLVRQEYTISAGDISRQVKFSRASKGSFSAKLLYKGRRVGLINFAAKPKKVTLGRKRNKGVPWGRVRTGVTVKVKKSGGRKQVTSRSAFIARGANGNQQVFYRNERGARSRSGKVKIHAMKLLSVPDMVTNAEGDQAAAYDQFAATEFAVEFDRAMDFYLGKQTGAT